MTKHLFEGIHAIFYDFDGTLINSLPLQHRAHSFVFQKYGCPITLENWREEWLRKGQGKREFIAKNNLDVDLEVARREVYKKYLELAEEGLELMPGTREVLGYTQTKYRQAICSSADIKTIEDILRRFELRSYFENIISDRHLEKHKPHPDVYLKAAESFGLLPSGCLVVEDSVIGFTAAARAGMRCIVCPDPYSGLSRDLYTYENQRPTLFVNLLKELVDHL